MHTLGVIGGLGPMATAYFMRMVTEMTEADRDQDHIPMLICSAPSIPDRTSYILGQSDADPAPSMSRIGRKLAEWGAEIIAVPCITAGYFYERLTQEIPVPVIHLIEETSLYLNREGVGKVGLMATDGTVKSGLFQESLQRRGIQTILPGTEEQGDVMRLIYGNVKASRPIEFERFDRVSRGLRRRGAEVILLGCTELSVVRRDGRIGAGYLDAMQVLAKCAVERCGVLKREYEKLITG